MVASWRRSTPETWRVELSEQTGSWQPDPFGRNQYRYWDGAQWTDQVSNDGVVTTDPAVADAAGAAVSETPNEPATPPAGESAGWAASSEPAPTTAVPTTSTPPAAYPAAGAPGGPTYQDPPPADTGDGGSKLPLIIVGVGLLALILGVGAYFVFFSGDDDDNVRGDLVSAFRGDPFNLTASQAECVVDELDGSTDLNAMHRSIAEGERATDAQTAAVVSALRDCDAPVPAGLGGDEGDDDDDTTTTTSTTEPDDDDENGGAIGGVTLPPAMIAMIAEQVSNDMGITQDQAECFVEGLLTSFSEEQFQAMITNPESLDFDAMSSAAQLFSDCGIDPATVAGGSGGGTTPGGGGGSSYGDDSQLDAMWDACEGGDMDSCDDLYFASPSGSEYERFADTCGGRQAEGTGNLCTVEFG